MTKTNIINWSSNVTHIKDKDDFLIHEKKGIFEEMIFFRIINDKVHIKISAPCYVNEVINLLSKIKD